MRLGRVSIVVMLGLSLMGCGGGPSAPKLPDPVKVNGVVVLDSQPLSDATIYFVPEGGKEMGTGATGLTNASGSFELVTMKGKSKQTGAIPGKYRVSISRLVGPDGKSIAPNADVAPANLGAVESLPPRFSDVMMTELKASVTQQGGTFDFSISSR